MENEEIMEIEEMEIEDIEEVEEPENSGKGILGAVLATLAVGAAGAGVWLWKTKDKRKAKRMEKRINELRGEGYIILKDVEDQKITNIDEFCEEE